MFNFLRRKDAPPPEHWLALRRKLFAMDDLDTLVAGLAPEGKALLPWTLFVSANEKRKSGQSDAAIADLQAVIALPDQETRVYLWAWHNLRALGVSPPAAQNHQVRGLVIETPAKNRREILAAYADYSARYFNYTGSILVWQQSDPLVNELIDKLLVSARPVLKKAQPWNKPEPGPPAPGLTRISILTDFGLHFGQGPYKALARDNLGGLPLENSARLLKALVDRAVAHPGLYQAL